MTAKAGNRKWSSKVTERSDALDLDPNIFEAKSPEAIAKSLKKAAESSHRRKAEPFRSAMSMLTFYINRAGKNLASTQRRTLEKAKNELRAGRLRSRTQMNVGFGPSAVGPSRDHVAFGWFRPNAKNVIDSHSLEHRFSEKPVPNFSRDAPEVPRLLRPSFA